MDPAGVVLTAYVDIYHKKFLTVALARVVLLA
jgi:hypothetical protein